MNFLSSESDYAATGYFTKIITSYLDQDPALKPFYKHPVNEEGIEAAIESRKNFPQNRQLLVQELRTAYSSLPVNDKISKQIDSLLDENTFTVCTAHQPNIFTGHLYFIYKILHTIKLADHLDSRHPGKHFVPVFYMGSEDADLEELGHIYLYGERYTWETNQTGAVGRMLVDDALIDIIRKLKGRLGVEEHGEELLGLLELSYTKGRSIEDATFHLVHILFAEYGLLVLLPDNKPLKSLMIDLFKDELLNQTSSAIVEQTVERLAENYKVQASPREINLFYLSADKRERIIKKDNSFQVLNSSLSFSQNELLQELEDHPERFSPNVILRGLFQETILPNIAFIGGGGELAYWLELKDLFEHYRIPFPVLILRNSFLLLRADHEKQMLKLSLRHSDIFKPEEQLKNIIVKKHSQLKLNLEEEKTVAANLFSEIKNVATTVDTTLTAHSEALLKKLTHQLDELEKKMLRAEKKKFDAELRQLAKLKTQLFPNNSLQERVENFMSWYAEGGQGFIKQLYHFSLILEQRFIILTNRQSGREEEKENSLTFPQKEKSN